MSGVMMAMHDGNAIDNKDGGATSVLMQVAHRKKGMMLKPPAPSLLKGQGTI